MSRSPGAWSGVAVRIVHVGVQPPRQRLAQVSGGEADHAQGAGSARRERRLDQSLEIDRDVVVRPPQLANRGDERQAGAGAAAIVDDEAAIDHRDEVENLPVFRADEPVDARGRKSAAQSGRDRYAVHDVAERAQTDQKESRQSYSFDV